MSSQRAHDSYDESDARVRPGRGSRPRSKIRPAHEEAESGFVVAVDRGRLTCLVGSGDVGRHGGSGDVGRHGGSGEPDEGHPGEPDEGHPDERVVTAMRARELGRKAVVVGDHVGIVGDTSGREGTLARIVRIDERATVLRRTADDDDPVERVIVANADQLAIVTAVADPEPRPRLIDRCLVAAYDAGLEPLLCVTKTDLADPMALLAAYAPLGVPTLTSAQDDELAALHDRLAGRRSVLVGHSGVGKSTLVNTLVPGADRATGEVNVVTGRGRHTSTSAVALRLPGGGWVFDTPGIRSFGLAHVDPARLITAFSDLAAETAECPRGCTHADGEPECALDDAITAGRLDPVRLLSYRRLLASRDRQSGD